MAKVEQVVRVLALIQELSTTRRGVSIARFAASKGWAERTVYNDVKKIEAAGFPLTSDRGRWRLHAKALGRWRDEQQVSK